MSPSPSPAALAIIPETAPFTLEQRAWLNGFVAGLVARLQPASAPTPASAPAAPARPLTILFGSQTGTAEALARKAAKEATKRGFAPVVADMATYTPAKLTGETGLLVITSTYGEGEPPDNAKALHAALRAANAPKLPASLRYSVCALGDRNYTQFCQCGREFDGFLEKLGATRTLPHVECDLDEESKFTGWLDANLAALGGDPAAGPVPVVLPPKPEAVAATPVTAQESVYSKKNPFPTPARVIRRLNGVGSAKEVHHIEFSLEGSNLNYEPGDALGVMPQNCPRLVTEILSALDCDGEEEVPAANGAATTLRRALTEHYDLGKPSAELLAALSTPSGPAAPLHVIDALLGAPDAGIVPVEFVRRLRKLQPRLYSISSSALAHPGRVHLTVGAVRYEAGGRARSGVCSTFLADRAAVAGSVGVFVHANPNFRLPATPDAPVIMVGPGTGIAPFRAFLHERRATGATGQNWLFFGDQHAATDFLYRDELEAFQRDGYLHRLDLAWSRDEEKKVYVQHRLLEHAKEIWSWLEAGAHFYVCGDASRMAKDVDAALHKIVETAGFKSPEQAALYVTGLRSARHYQRDVY